MSKKFKNLSALSVLVVKKYIRKPQKHEVHKEEIKKLNNKITGAEPGIRGSRRLSCQIFEPLLSSGVMEETMSKFGTFDENGNDVLFAYPNVYYPEKLATGSHIVLSLPLLRWVARRKRIETFFALSR